MWALGNVVTKRVGKVDLLAMSLIFAGPARIESSLATIPLISVFGIAYLSFVATIVGYSLWGKLLARYPAAQVAPFSLLVPVIGIASAEVFLGEAMNAAQVAGAALVMLGLMVNVFGGRIAQRFVAAAR